MTKDTNRLAGHVLPHEGANKIVPCSNRLGSSEREVLRRRVPSLARRGVSRTSPSHGRIRTKGAS